jgi:four helix bundle protein
LAIGYWLLAIAGKPPTKSPSVKKTQEHTMPKYEHFEDLPVWREAAKLYNLVLDLFEQQKLPLTYSFRNQLDRAALSISNNIAEGFDRTTTRELHSFLGIARGSAGEVRSMIAVVQDRPTLSAIQSDLLQIRGHAQSCARQITAWQGSIDSSPVQGKRHLTGAQKEMREAGRKAREFRLNFLRNLKPEHPLYSSREAQAARGETVD